MVSATGTIIGRISLADIQQDIVRNIVSIRDSQNLFDDLSDDANDWTVAQIVEMQHKPPHYTNRDTILNRPFEETNWANAIQWPFKNWQSSRFSNGTFGVWYGSACEQTTVYETAYHWHHGLLSDAGFEREPVVAERKLYNVECRAGLLDFRPLAVEFPDVVHETDYSAAQALGARLHREGHPGIVVPSVRDPSGENFVVLTPSVLTNPRARCYMTYRMVDGVISVEKVPGAPFMQIAP